MIAELREDLLKVKKEKRTLSDNLKAGKKKHEHSVEEANILKQKNEEDQVLLKNKLKMLDKKEVEIEKIRAENSYLKQVTEELKAEFNKQRLKDQANKWMENKCSECDTVVDNPDQMKDHKTIFHSYNKSCEYNDNVALFEEHSCFYCGTIIT